MLLTQQLKWIKTNTNYVIGKATEMEGMLNWAEKFQTKTITEHDVTG